MGSIAASTAALLVIKQYIFIIDIIRKRQDFATSM